MSFIGSEKIVNSWFLGVYTQTVTDDTKTLCIHTIGIAKICVPPSLQFLRKSLLCPSTSTIILKYFETQIFA